MTFQPRKLSARTEKREAWRSRLDKPIGRGTLLALIPTLAMCVFLVMSAPYLKIIAVRFFEIEKDHVVLSVDLAEDTEAVAPIGPPPNPELAIAKIYQKLYDEEGFDWRNPPVIEYPEIKREEIRKEIKPVEVEWPLMRNVGLVELEKSSSN
jgi:hypothetical protein